MLLTIAIAWACSRILIMVIFGLGCYRIGWNHGTFEAWGAMQGFSARRYRPARERVERLESDLLMDRLKRELDLSRG